MPENPWTPDLERVRGDLDRKIETSRIGLREEIARSAAETRRHFDVVDRLRAEMGQRFDQVERRLLRLS